MFGFLLFFGGMYVIILFFCYKNIKKQLDECPPRALSP